MLRHVTYVPIPRFLVIVRIDYYAHCQFRRNPGPRYLWMVHFVPYNKTITGEETARLFMNDIYKLYHGLHDDIIFNRGS
jgi:hypothetical protein